MTRNLYLLWDGDSYEVEVNDFNIVGIWRYKDNNNSRPEFCHYDKLTPELRNEIDHKILKVYGEPNL